MFRAIGLSTHVWNNTIRGMLLLAGFPVLLVILAFGVSMVFSAGDGSVSAGFAHAWRNLPAFVGGAVVVSLAWFAIAWVAHQRIIDAVSGARVASRQSDRRLWDLMETLCIARGETMPRLALIDSQARNAFAAGLDRRRGSITVTSGLVAALDDRQLSAVLAHELTHIRNGDARLAVIAAIFTGILTLGFDLFRQRRGGGVADAGAGGSRTGNDDTLRGRRSSGSSSRDGGANVAILAIGLVIVVLAGTLSVALRLALSRNREFLADAGAVQITGDADAMIGALRRIEGRAELALPGQIQAMLLEHAAGTRGGGWWATHPPITARIEALVRLAGGRDPGPLADATADQASAFPDAGSPIGPPSGVPSATPPGAPAGTRPGAPSRAPPWGNPTPLPIPGLPPVLLPGGLARPVATHPPVAPLPQAVPTHTETFADEIAALRTRRPPEA